MLSVPITGTQDLVETGLAGPGVPQSSGPDSAAGGLSAGGPGPATQPYHRVTFVAESESES